MSAQAYSLRQRLDLVSGLLLLLLGGGASLALVLAQEQRHDAMLLMALQEQERAVYELVASPSDGAEANFQGVLVQLARNLHALRHGGELTLAEGQRLAVAPAAERLMIANLDGAMRWLHPHLESLAQAPDAATQDTAHETFRRQAAQLQIFLRATAASAQRRAAISVVRSSGIFLVLIIGGLVVFLVGVVFVRRMLTLPLQRMVRAIRTMQARGRMDALPVADGHELGVVAGAFNQLAEQVEQHRWRLREHITELKRMNKELDRLAGVKDDFLATVSHQFRTPLTAIVESVELLRDTRRGSWEPQDLELVQVLDDNAARLTALIEQVLDLSMLKSGQRSLSRHPSHLKGVLERCVRTWQPTDRSRTIHLDVDDLPPVQMDSDAIGDVVDHLIRNALKHAPAGDTIEVGAHVVDGFVEVSVEDHGVGMPPEHVMRLFEPFMHVQNPEAPGSHGSGLGLAFCRQVVERHRGEIRAESTQGHGTIIRFTLPQASPRFVFQDACRTAQEAAEHQEGQYGIVVAVPGAHAQVRPGFIATLEEFLQRHTQRGDTFIRLDERTLVIVAVTNQAGLEAMAARLRGTLRDASHAVDLGTAAFPRAGTTPGDLLKAARASSEEGTQETHGTMTGPPPLDRRAPQHSAGMPQQVGRGSSDG